MKRNRINTRIALAIAILALTLATLVATARPYHTPDSLGVVWDNIGGVEVIDWQPAIILCGVNVDC